MMRFRPHREQGNTDDMDMQTRITASRRMEEIKKCSAFFNSKNTPRRCCMKITVDRKGVGLAERTKAHEWAGNIERMVPWFYGVR